MTNLINRAYYEIKNGPKLIGVFRYNQATKTFFTSVENGELYTLLAKDVKNSGYEIIKVNEVEILTLEITALVKTFDNYTIETEQDLIKKEVCRRCAVSSAKIADYAKYGNIDSDNIEKLNNLMAVAKNIK